MEQNNARIAFLHRESDYERRNMRIIISVVYFRKLNEVKRVILEIIPTAVVNCIRTIARSGYT